MPITVSYTHLYEGPIAHTIDAYFKRIGGWLSYDDLRNHHSDWTQPLVTTYRLSLIHI